MGVLNRIGIGSATVDAVFEAETVQPGETVPVRLEIEGGSEDQTVNTVVVNLLITWMSLPNKGGVGGQGQTQSLIHRTELTDGFTIAEGQEETLDGYEITVPEYAPPTESLAVESPVGVHTALDIDWATDPKDSDRMFVEPGRYYRALYDAVENAGFTREATTKTTTTRAFRQTFTPEKQAPYVCVATIFSPKASGPYADELEQLTVCPVRKDGRLHTGFLIDENGPMQPGPDEQVIFETTDTDSLQTQVRNAVDERL